MTGWRHLVSLRFGIWLALGFGLLLPGACATKRFDLLELMPIPTVFDLLPVGGSSPSGKPPSWILYATDRAPRSHGVGMRDKDEDDGAEHRESAFYANERAHLVRLGKASLKIGDDPIDGVSLRDIAQRRRAADRYPLAVSQIEELGILDRSYHPFRMPLPGVDTRAPAARYAEIINNKLATSQRKDIYLYVNGYLVIFDKPILIAAEMWHYLGYEGVAIAYSWPSTPRLLAYFKDAETTIASARQLRILLEYLAEETDAERIHIVCYSQGTRLVVEALYNLALMHADSDRATVQRRLRIGNVMLVGSDIDAEIFGSFLIDGLTKVAEHLNIYVSGTDQALRSAGRVLAPNRLGEIREDQLTAEVIRGLRKFDADMSFIDVTGVEGADRLNGHHYLRSSPWASSDILMAMRYRLEPSERGLVRADGGVF